jgi:hypothetical protein
MPNGSNLTIEPWPLSPLLLGNGDPTNGLVPTEYKRDSFGVMDGRIVAVDYG